MLAIKPEYTEAYEKNFVGVPCVKEYLIATAMANDECNDIYDVMRHFNLTRDEAVIILDSRAFNVVLDKVIAAKKVLGRAELLNRLIDIINNGDPDNAIDAIKTLDYLASQWNLKPNRTKKKQSRMETKRADSLRETAKAPKQEEATEFVVDGVIADSDEFVEVDD
jgi:hypothetical protein